MASIICRQISMNCYVEHNSTKTEQTKNKQSKFGDEWKYRKCLIYER